MSKENTFYNTIGLWGDDLSEAIAKATSQQEIVYLFFSSGKKYTASDMTTLTESIGRKWPIWSNRRAITNLMNEGKLIKLDELKTGPMGKPEHLYQLTAKVNSDAELHEWFDQYLMEKGEESKSKYTQLNLL